MIPSRSLARLGAIGVAAAAALSGCAAPVHLSPAPYAPDPVCARVFQKMPRTIAGMKQISTDAQASMAYGDPQAPVTIRCGLNPPPPTTDRCLSVSASTAKDTEADGIDWINPEYGSSLIPVHAPDSAWTFITYGRTPAIEVVVPAETGLEQPTAVLLAMTKAVEEIEATTHCVGATDVVGDRPSN
ncbi:DUF3515 family protein [Bowdeniella massiliensis]|uniref:DUF3515 family protein n=1 Tax=Bowdeniella massiliensis TaxID=2932264 RepID=UPI0020278FBD